MRGLVRPRQRLGLLGHPRRKKNGIYKGGEGKDVFRAGVDG